MKESSFWKAYICGVIALVYLYYEHLLALQLIIGLIYIMMLLAIPITIMYYLLRYGILENVHQPRVFGTGFRVMYKKLSLRDRQILDEKNKYYNQLNLQNKKEFEYRVILFLQDKKFIAKRFPTVTSEMKLMIASSAVQLSFGYSAITLKHFQKIFIYPRVYVSSHSGRLHKGEVNSAGAIVFSWEDFVLGYQNHTDGYNVGLHEMAHAMYLEDFIKNGEDDFINPTELRKFRSTGKLEIAKIKSNENMFLRDYAATNIDEFFAVCIEQFFEQAEEFKLKLPYLYKNLQALLNQDPCNKANPVC